MCTDNLWLYFDTVRIKTKEIGEGKWYLDFLMHQFTVQECCVFAAPFIKDDPITENLTIYQPYSPGQLRAMLPENQEFCHIVLEYWSCDTAEKAYLWAKQFLRDAGVSTLCVIVIHCIRGKYHAHILIGSAYPQQEIIGYIPYFFPSDDFLSEAARRIPVEACESILKVFYPMVIAYDSTYGREPLTTL